MEKLKFSGPLFIIGTSRSGTKLLRDLLNNHDNIFLTISETHFIPGMLKKYRGLHFTSEYKVQFYKEFIKSNFHLKMLNHSQVISKTQFTKYTQSCYSIESIIEMLVKFYCTNGFSLLSYENSFIWGDKTPSYSNHIMLLKRHYPKAKFIHMIRDPRDVALSYKKSWGKSLYSSAFKWKNTIEKVRIQSNKLTRDLLEIRYEELISEPETSLRKICQFIECEYSSKLLNLNVSSEYFGDAKGLTTILAGNFEKYKSELKPSQINRIEEICFNTAINKGYSLLYAKRCKGLNKIEIFIYKLYDFFNYSLHIIFKERGFREGVIYLFRSVKTKFVNLY